MRTFAKILVSVALFGVVIGVSYLKSDLNESRIDQVVSESVEERLSEAESVVDSAETQFAVPMKEENVQRTDFQRTDLQTGDAKTARTVEGSAADETAAPPVSLAVSQVAKKTQPVTEPKIPKPAPAEVTYEQPVDSAKIIADYYQGQLDKLPTDLTSYEKKVALKEIRDEVCEYFRISPKRLSKIARSHKVRYP